MEINVQSIHFNADQKLLNFLEKKYNKLDLFFDKITSADVILRLEKSEDAANKIVEVKLNIPGHALFVKHQCSSFEEAADLCVESLGKQLKKHKEKLKTPAGVLSARHIEINENEI